MQQLSLPSEFVAEMSHMLGHSFPLFEKAMDNPPATAIRLNTRKPSHSLPAPPLRTVDWCQSGIYLTYRPVFTLDPLLHAGAYYVQDPSSMIYQQATGLILQRPDMVLRMTHNEPLRVLDLCAAPGGKTTAMINALPDGAVVVANEIDRQRCTALRENLEKWGYPDIVVCNSDADTIGQHTGLFDIIAVDAPCSGEGMMRKEPEAINQWSRQLTERCAETQRSILNKIIPALRPGGYLIYSTCTFNRSENECITHWLAEQHGLQPVDLPFEGTDRVLPGIDTSMPALRFMPHATDGEGLFVCVMRAPGNGMPASLPSLKPQSGKKTQQRQPRKKKNQTPDNPTQWIMPDKGYTLSRRGDTVVALTETTARMAAELEHTARVVMAGSAVAETKGDMILPSGKLPFSLAFRKDAFPSVEVDKATALCYLRRDTVTLPDHTPVGYVTLTYENTPLGLLKNIGTRSNNLFPSAWRIRTRDNNQIIN